MSDLKPPPPADFDDAMRRVLGIPADRARQIVERTAPGKPKAEREKVPAPPPSGKHPPKRKR